MKKQKYAILLLLLMLVLLVFPAPAVAGERQVIRVGCIDEAGFIEKLPDGTYSGYMVEYLEKIAEYTDWQYEFVMDTWENNLHKLETGELDFVFNAQYTPERAERFMYSSYPIGLESSYLYTLPENKDIYYNDFKSMEGKRIALLAGTYQTERIAVFAENIGWNYEAMYFATDTEVIECLRTGKADLIALGSLSAHDDLKKVGVFGAAEYYAIANKEHGSQLMGKLDEALGELLNIHPDFQQELQKKYYGNHGNYADAQELTLTREEENYRRNCGVLKVAIPTDEYPLSYYDEETGTFSGIYVDLLNIISENSGLKFEHAVIKPGQWGDYDLRFGQSGDIISDAYYVTIPCMETYAVGISRTDKEINLDMPLTVAVSDTNYLLYTYLTKYYPQYDVIAFGNTEAGLDAVLNGTADLAIQDKYVITYLAQQKQYRELVILPMYSIPGNIGFFMPKESDRLLRSILNKTILTITEDQRAEMNVNYTIISHYDMSVAEFCMKYRGEIMAIIASVIALIFLIRWATKKYTERKLLQKEAETLRVLAERDALTGLYSRQTFYNKARELIQSTEEPHDILTLNMEHFKVVNELYGTQEGDRILIRIAEILSEELAECNGISGRLAADNFAICMPTEANTPEFRQRVHEQIRTYPLHIRISIRFGIYHIKDVTRDISNMCDKANLAADHIRNNYHVSEATYSGKHREIMLNEQSILNDMENALSEGHFLMFLQPKNLLETGEIVGCEALVRWRHPVRGMISPGEFIPIFEQNGFITKLDHYIWEEACKFIRYCMDNNYPVIPVSVNVSRINFYDLEIAEYLEGLVKKYQIDPRYLELEITESAYIGDAEQLFATQEQLKDFGFRFLMDDFGSGYSSLNTLKDLPVDVLKLDLRFLQTERVEGRSKVILSSVMHMADELKMPVIAEGLETEEQLQLLRKIGCKTGQGYYFSKPIAVDDFLRMLLEKQGARIANA